MFWTRENVFILGQLLITLGVTAVTAFLYATGQAVPGELLGINGLIVGHYFGAATKTNGAFSAGRQYEKDKTIAVTGSVMPGQ
jgi:hypothetical protein